MRAPGGHITNAGLRKLGRWIVGERSTDRLLVAAAAVYGAGVFLLIEGVRPGAVAWVTVAAMTGLVAVAAMARAVRAVGLVEVASVSGVAKDSGTVVAGRSRRLHPRDEWTGQREMLMRKPLA